MSRQQYVADLRRLGLTHASKAAAERLGITVRQSIRFANGENQIPKTIQLLLSALIALEK